MQENNSDFNNALLLYDKNFSHEDLINLLKDGTVIERQYAALTLDKICDSDEALILLKNLVGVDGKIREAAALKISELTKISPELFFNENTYHFFSEATIDIDGNVCRLAIDSAQNLSSNTQFSIFYSEQMLSIINAALDEISKFTFRDKKYKINKQVFKIYWCLEALSVFYKFVDIDKLLDLLIICSNLQEYTIREKCAKITLTLGKNSKTKPLFDKLEADDNYYVRNIFNN